MTSNPTTEHRFFCNYWQLLEMLDCFTVVHCLTTELFPRCHSGIYLPCGSVLLQCLIDHYVIALLILLKKVYSIKVVNYKIMTVYPVIIAMI